MITENSTWQRMSSFLVRPLSQHLFIAAEIKFSTEIFYWGPKVANPQKGNITFQPVGDLAANHQ